MGCSYGYVVSLRYMLAVEFFIAGMPLVCGDQRFSWDGDLEFVNDATCALLQKSKSYRFKV
jgi:hypothetical protein